MLDAGVSEDIVDPKDAAEYAGLSYVNDGDSVSGAGNLARAFAM